MVSTFVYYKLTIGTISNGIRTLFVSNAGLENAKRLVAEYKLGKGNGMTPELWQAKKIVDSTLHPGALLPAIPFQKHLEWH